jgi:hypothetical protein
MLGSWFEHNMLREQIKNMICDFHTRLTGAAGEINPRLPQKAAIPQADLNMTR